MAAQITVGTYIGPIDKFKNCTALIRYDTDGLILAQFDDMSIKYHGILLGVYWHRFANEDFKVKKIKDNGASCRYPKVGGDK
jgi:hypothetical protein